MDIKDYGMLQDVCQKLADNAQIVDWLEEDIEIESVKITIAYKNDDTFDFTIPNEKIRDAVLLRLKEQLKSRASELYVNLIATKE